MAEAKKHLMLSLLLTQHCPEDSQSQQRESYSSKSKGVLLGPSPYAKDTLTNSLKPREIRDDALPHFHGLCIPRCLQVQHANRPGVVGVVLEVKVVGVIGVVNVELGKRAHDLLIRNERRWGCHFDHVLDEVF